MRRVSHSEGFYRVPAPCPAGHISIGYGHNLEQSGMGKSATNKFLGKDIDKGITEGDAKKLLKYDLDEVRKSIKEDKRLGPLFAKLDDERQYVLLDLCYNMGVPKVKKFNKMLTAMENGDYEKASEELRRSRYAKQTGPRARRNVEALRTGEWSDEDPKKKKTKKQIKTDKAKADTYGAKKEAETRQATQVRSEVGRAPARTAAPRAAAPAQRQAAAPAQKQTAAPARTGNATDKDVARMRSMLNNLNRANGKNSKIDVDKTIEALTAQYGSEASKIMTKVMMSPTAVAKNMDLRDKNGKLLTSSRQIIQRLSQPETTQERDNALAMVAARRRGREA